MSKANLRHKQNKRCTVKKVFSLPTVLGLERNRRRGQGRLHTLAERGRGKGEERRGRLGKKKKSLIEN